MSEAEPSLGSACLFETSFQRSVLLDIPAVVLPCKLNELSMCCVGDCQLRVFSRGLASVC